MNIMHLIIVRNSKFIFSGNSVGKRKKMFLQTSKKKKLNVLNLLLFVLCAMSVQCVENHGTPLFSVLFSFLENRRKNTGCKAKKFVNAKTSFLAWSNYATLSPSPSLYLLLLSHCPSIFLSHQTFLFCFLYRTCDFKMWVILTLHNFLSFVVLSFCYSSYFIFW